MVEILREEQYGLFTGIYDAARELRADLECMHSTCTNPEDKYVATFSIQDDLATFMRAMKTANRVMNETQGSYLTKYDDYLKTKGGQYALAKGMLSVMDSISFESKKKEA